MRYILFFIVIIFSCARSFAAFSVLVPTPASPLIYQVNGPTITLTLTCVGDGVFDEPIEYFDFSALDTSIYFDVANNTCAAPLLAGNSCTLDITPKPAATLPVLTTIPIMYRSDTDDFPVPLNMEFAILQVGDAWQGGTIYEISQAPNANATGTTVIPNVSNGPWDLNNCINFTGGGQNNWVMPTMSQLNTIWPLSNCNAGVVGGFSCASNVFYWSSEQLLPPPPTNDGSVYIQVKNFGRNCNGADKNIHSHQTPCVRTF